MVFVKILRATNLKKFEDRSGEILYIPFLFPTVEQTNKTKQNNTKHHTSKLQRMASHPAPDARPSTSQTTRTKTSSSTSSTTPAKSRPMTTSSKTRKRRNSRSKTNASKLNSRAPHGHGKASEDFKPADGAVWVPPSRFGPGHWVRKNKVRALPAATLLRLTKPPKSKVKPRLPATGKYLRPGGGRFSSAKPKSEIDWVILRAKDSPGPSEYRLPDHVVRGATKISDANPKSDVDWVIYRSKQTPGPNEYKVGGIQKTGGGRFSTAYPMSDLEWTIWRAKQTPAPDEYLIDRCPTYPKSSMRWVNQMLKQSPIKRKSSFAKFKVYKVPNK